MFPSQRCFTKFPHDKLKLKLRDIIEQCFFHRNGNLRFQNVVFGYADRCFGQGHSDAPQNYSDADLVKMLEYLIDNILKLWSLVDGGHQQSIGIPMEANCAPLLADLFLHSYETAFRSPSTAAQFAFCFTSCD